MAEMPSAGPPAALDGVRVLDLAGPLGVYCARLLANLGADVIRIEPPAGDASRHLGPFYQDEPGLERSLFHWHFNAEKRGVTLDIATRDGKALLLQLVEHADVLIETFRPGYLDGLGLGYESLSSINPRLIVTSITPFGQVGPYRGYEAEELIIQAASGFLLSCGWPDRPPAMMGGHAALHQGSTEAASATLIALEHCRQMGEGQWIDVSSQACLQWAIGLTPLTFYLTGAKPQPPRVGDKHRFALNGLFACEDGYADLRFRGRPGQWERLLIWMKESGVEAAGIAAELADEHWCEHDFRNQPENMRSLDDLFQRFALTLSRDEFTDGAQRCGFEVGAVYTAKDIVEDPQLQARHFFVEVQHNELGRSILYPGGPYSLSETPWRLSRRAPLLGEHNVAVFEGELGLSRDQLASLSAAGVI